jgi:hypothetical protein
MKKKENRENTQTDTQTKKKETQSHQHETHTTQHEFRVGTGTNLFDAENFGTSMNGWERISCGVGKLTNPQVFELIR